jgi:hypothetical protein
MLPTSKRSPFKACKKSQYLRLAVEFDDFANVGFIAVVNIDKPKPLISFGGT